eukprot:UN19112
MFIYDPNYCGCIMHGKLSHNQLRLHDDLTLIYSDVSQAMQKLDKTSMRVWLDSSLMTFIQERGKHPGCPNHFIPIDEIQLTLLDFRLEWNDEDFRLQQNLNKLYEDHVEIEQDQNDDAHPVHLAVDAHITHGKNLDIFSNR